MPSILSDDDKDTVKRFVPKQSNKIQAVAVAKLYVAYPNRSKWTYTGLQGAIVLSNDLVGNTYWIKLVDISPSNRGVIWDQEIFDTWTYHQDRTFFHTFELEECVAGLSFVDEKEAKQFKKKMDDREKNASKATRATHFGGAPQPEKKHGHGLLGGLFGSRHSSAPSPTEAQRHTLPPQPSHHMSTYSLNGSTTSSEFSILDEFDPMWRENFGQDLKDKGLTDDFIKENQEFIIEFVREQQQATPPEAPKAASHAPPPPPPSAPPLNGHDARSSRPPPPPPPGGRSEPMSPPANSKAPPPPAPRRSGKTEHESRDSPEPSPVPPRVRFNAPPPLADAGKYAKEAPKTAPLPPPRSTGPPPPPRPAKTPIEENSSHKFGVPPPFAGQRNNPPLQLRVEDQFPHLRPLGAMLLNPHQHTPLHPHHLLSHQRFQRLVLPLCRP
ncbi:hypothetical protein V2G26_016833 [Clonostachys chloroleuca]